MTTDLTPDVRLALGTNSFGWTSSQDESFSVLDAFVEAGGEHIDTADSYSAFAEGNSGGESEEIIGRWLAARGNRDDVFVATKVSAHPEREGLSRENVPAALEDSLRRLQTDHVDLYYAHWDDESQTTEQLADTFDALVRKGTVRHIGISNLPVERQQAWIDHATAENLTVPVAIQPQYSLAHRADVENGYGPLARRNGLAIFSYFSLAAGLLSGKYRSGDDVAGAARVGMLEQYANQEGFALVEKLVEVAEARGDAPSSVALAWLIAKGVTAPIASARTTEQLPDLLAATTLGLSAEEIRELDNASQPFA